ncbi:MAG: DHHA1 domain-containing protein [Candidatus Acidiferrales bacterium]
MTERLYYTDAFLKEFDAQVVACEPAGERWHAVLDRTAFYPTSGGQPNDLGRLADVSVLDVLEDENGEVLHVTDKPLARGPVRGSIDWSRRFDQMQQHTGQHLVSAAFIEKFNFPTVSFHLGREISTIDIAAPSVVPRHLEEVERRTNEIIFEDRPIEVQYGTAKELMAQGIRKTVDREGLLRVIGIEGFDRQPCGGTHLSRTGQAGILLIRKCEKQKQHWRIEFVVGFRALAAARADRSSVGAAAEQIGCGMPEVPAMVEKVLAERRGEHRDREKLLARLAELEAQSMLTTARAAGGERRGASVISRIWDDADARFLRLLATNLVRESGTIALLATRADGNVVFARSDDLSADMGTLLRETLAAHGAKGGGTKSFAQGSVRDAALLDRVLTEAATRLTG